MVKIAISPRAALPLQSLEALAKRADPNTQVYQLMGLGAHPLYGTPVPVYTLFVDAAARNQPNVRYVPWPYSQAEVFLKRVNPDAAVLACAVRDGMVSWGVSWDVSGFLYDFCPLVILEVNSQMPFTGAGAPLRDDVEMRRVDYQLPTYTPRGQEITPEESAIARRIAEILPSGVALQVGVGSIPEAVCRALIEMRKPVRVWTEAFSDPLMDLCEAGLAIGNPVCSFLWGSRRLYQWANGAGLDMRPLAAVNRGVGLSGPLWSILGAIEVGEDGAINAECLMGAQYSGTGGHLDFAILARQTGGRVVVGCVSHARGKPKLTAAPCAVTTPRTVVDFVVTERGIAYIGEISLEERRDALRQIFRSGV